VQWPRGFAKYRLATSAARGTRALFNIARTCGYKGQSMLPIKLKSPSDVRPHLVLNICVCGSQCPLSGKPLMKLFATCCSNVWMISDIVAFRLPTVGPKQLRPSASTAYASSFLGWAVHLLKKAEIYLPIGSRRTTANTQPFLSVMSAAVTPNWK